MICYGTRSRGGAGIHLRWCLSVPQRVGRPVALATFRPSARPRQGITSPGQHGQVKGPPGL